MRLRARPSQLRCGYCLEGVEGAARRCPECGAIVHAPCARELGYCPTLGCEHPAWVSVQLLAADPPTTRRALLALGLALAVGATLSATVATFALRRRSGASTVANVAHAPEP